MARETRPSSRRKGAYHHGDLPGALRAAALTLIEEQGPRGFTLREVARRAGVSHAAPYRHFADRDALLSAIAEEGFGLLDAAMHEAMDRIDDPGDAMRRAGCAYVEFAVAHPAHYRIMFGDALPADCQGEGASAAGDAAFQTLIDGITACQEAGVIGGGDPMPYAVAAWSSVHGLALLLIDGRLDDPDGALPGLVTGLTFPWHAAG